MGGEGTAAPPLHKSESREGSLLSPTPLPPPAGSAEASAGDGAEEAGKNLDGSLGADSVATDEDVEVDVEVDDEVLRRYKEGTGVGVGGGAQR